MPPEKTCTAPACTRAAVARGLCPSHYKQKQRGSVPRALRPKPPEPLVRVSLRVSIACRERILADAAGARAALEAWSQRQKQGGPLDPGPSPVR